MCDFALCMCDFECSTLQKWGCLLICAVVNSLSSLVPAHFIASLLKSFFIAVPFNWQQVLTLEENAKSKVEISARKVARIH